MRGFIFGLSASLSALIPFAAFAQPDAKVIEAARKEGELAWWSTIAQDQSQKLIEEFMKRYPFIKASYWRSGSVGLHQKMIMEASAARFSWDVASQTTPEFIYELKQKKLISPYASPERRYFSADLKDKDGYWTGTYALPTGVGYNTQQVKKDDVPKSYKDLLDPKWKGGKISIDDENYELLVGLGPGVGPESRRRLPESPCRTTADRWPRSDSEDAASRSRRISPRDLLYSYRRMVQISGHIRSIGLIWTRDDQIRRNYAGRQSRAPERRQTIH